MSLLIGSGMLAGAFWPRRLAKPASQERIFIFEEEIPASPLPPDPPPPPKIERPRDPEPPPPKAERPPDDPSPQFGLEDEALAETGDLAVAAGNTLMKEAEPVAAPPPPPLPPAPALLDRPPRVLSGPPPAYPPRALDRGLEGTVIVLIAVDTAGRVAGMEVEQSDGWEFTESVRKALLGTTFAAPIRDGHPVTCTFRRAFEFRLEE